ncbi:hypothetical protein KTAU_15730 [Thermogemmatispora aurantia]|uniref:DUF1464 domain-containing protein n=1 Tax=Thermogemmatispora aurantia TaxID=2045279 RepID=A0A5J4K9X7_9CHLR|nr:DUF1464 family protein [Thermogemmatispora aurantia]GER82936.1 hypothetical protein KTAU_15730 [Thermogemmatispora aurantia]
MSLSIGIDYGRRSWKLCLLDEAQPPEYHCFASPAELLASLTRLCALFPEPVITLAAGNGLPLERLDRLVSEQIDALTAGYDEPVFPPSTPAASAVSETLPQTQESPPLVLASFLETLRSLNLHSYVLPSLAHLPTVPAYRLLLERLPSSPAAVCRVVTLLYRLRQREASWPEMRFLVLEARSASWQVLVVEDGYLTNGVHGKPQDLTLPLLPLAAAPTEGLFEQAYWEGLLRDLAGLLAIHHLDEVVISGRRSETLATRLGEVYQLYYFPYAPQEPHGFEAALGAALIASGLQHPRSLAAEVVQHLQLWRSVPVF